MTSALKPEQSRREIVEDALERMHEAAYYAAEAIAVTLPSNSWDAVGEVLKTHLYGAWLPISTAPKDGRWLIALCNDKISLMRISWGRDRHGKLSWCTADGGGYGDGLFSPFGGWIEFPPEPPK